MEEISLIYNEEENAWCSEKIALNCDILLKVAFAEHGKVVITKQNDADGPAPKMFISDETEEVQLTLKGHTAGKTIQIFTSVEPKSVEYITL